MIGQTVSHYKILEHLGGGGMGVVYRAQDLRLDRPVALKFLSPNLTRDLKARQRFVHEAKTASALQHINICTVHDIDQTPDGQIFIVMDLYTGGTLEKKIERGPLPIDEAVEIISQVAQGLAKAHEVGIVHRDIKPANLIVTDDGILKILDFGLAKLSDQTVLTKTGWPIGTAAYMSPEQARGESTDRRTDIWSLGVTFYEMLTGRRPFESEYQQALVYSIMNEDAKPTRDIRPDVPKAIEKICQRAMAKDPKDRYQTASEFLADIESYKAGIQLSSQTRKMLAKKHVVLYVGLAAIVFAIAMVVILVSTGGGTVIDRVGVLPFHNLSKDSTQELYADAITEEIISKLQQVASLNVPSSIMKFKKSQATYAEIAHEINAKALICGSIQIVNNRVHVIAKLIDPATDGSLWTETYDDNMEDILNLQSKIAQAVVGVVRVNVTRDEAARLGLSRKVDPEVYSTTLQGKAKATLEHATSEKEIRQAIELFRKAIDRDSTYAPAWAGLGEALWMLAETGFECVAPAEVRDKSITAVEKALELDPNLPDAHKARAVIAFGGEWDLAEAQRQYERALELQPGYAAAHNLYGQMLSGMPLPHFEEARRHFDRARELDPLSPWNEINMIAWWQNQGRLEKALEECERARMHDPNLWTVGWQIGFVKLVLGRPSQATPQFEAVLKLFSPDRPSSVLTPLGLAYGLAGRRTDAQKILAEMDQASRERYISPFYLATVYSGLGRMDEAFRLLDQALEQRTPYLVLCTPLDPLSVALRRDQRWRPFVDRLRKLVRLPAGTSDPYL
jgi:serine/threonine protein kinase/Flp pilus assembly protein TadD